MKRNGMPTAELLDQPPPHDADAERALLGAIIIAPDQLDDVRQIIGAHDYYLTTHQIIYQRMLDLRRDDVAIDTTTLRGRLIDRGDWDSIGGAVSLAEIMQACPTAANAVHYAQTVRQHAQARRLRQMAERIVVGLATGRALDELLAAVRSTIDAIDRGPTAAIYPPVVVPLADVVPEPVAWLWPGRIALGKLTLIAGDPGLGKSWVSLDLAARVSLGAPWPDNRDTCAPLGGVVILTAEDGLADTVRPRLDAMGADVARIVAIDAVKDGDRLLPVNLERDLLAIDETIKQVPDCRLVVIDPLSAYLGKTDSHNNADVRGLLHPLGELADRNKVAVVGVTHLNKGTGGSALYRATGSLAFVAAARAVLMVVRDQEDKRRRLVISAKNNLAPETPGMGFVLQDSLVQWQPEPVTIDADAALHPAGADDAVDWLRGMLADGPVVASELFEAAEAEGLSRKALRRAKTVIGATSRRIGYGPGGRWEWFLSGADAAAEPEAMAGSEAC